jgi:hypothetical protein
MDQHQEIVSFCYPDVNIDKRKYFMSFLIENNDE